MSATVTSPPDLDVRQVRVEHAAADRALATVLGQPAIAARARLRFGPGRTCEPLARLLDTVLTAAERAGLDTAHLVVADGSVAADEDIVRVRRKAHGKADWIASPTSHVRLALRPAGIAARDAVAADLAAPTAADSFAGCLLGDDTHSAAVHATLFDVIDPDLGINIVDLGFVRAIRTEQRTAVITMTLTSAACPLTGVMEDQIRTELARVPDIDGFRVDWEWVPAWRPADITDSGREQLHAIGFTV